MSYAVPIFTVLSKNTSKYHNVNVNIVISMFTKVISTDDRVTQTANISLVCDYFHNGRRRQNLTGMLHRTKTRYSLRSRSGATGMPGRRTPGLTAGTALVRGQLSGGAKTWGVKKARTWRGGTEGRQARNKCIWISGLKLSNKLEGPLPASKVIYINIS